MLLLARICARRASAEWPSGRRTAVSEAECSASTAHCVSKPQCRTAVRVSLTAACARENTFGSPSSRSMSSATFRACNMLVAGIVGRSVHVGPRQRNGPNPRIGHRADSSGAPFAIPRWCGRPGERGMGLLRSANRNDHAPFVAAIVPMDWRRRRSSTHQRRRMPGGINRRHRRGDVNVTPVESLVMRTNRRMIRCALSSVRTASMRAASTRAWSTLSALPETASRVAPVSRTSRTGTSEQCRPATAYSHEADFPSSPFQCRVIVTTDSLLQDLFHQPETPHAAQPIPVRGDRSWASPKAANGSGVIRWSDLENWRPAGRSHANCLRLLFSVVQRALSRATLLLRQP